VDEPAKEKADDVPEKEPESVEVPEPEPEVEAPQEEVKVEAEFKPKNDYSIIDELMEFLEVAEESQDNDVRLEPILCGYFNKVMTALLQK